MATVPDGVGLKKSKMGWRDYARFSERCLRSNPAITPENCLEKRAAEKTMKTPFRLAPGLGDFLHAPPVEWPSAVGAGVRW